MSTPNIQTCDALLAAMVSFDTVSRCVSHRPEAERALAEFLDEYARSLGLRTRRLAVAGAGFNLLVTLPTPVDAPTLLFVSHLDTVGVEGMTIDPFKVKVSDGRMHGRGTCDTKGSGAAMLWAMARYHRERPDGNNVALLFSLDEEMGKLGIDSFVRHDMNTLPSKPAGAVVGEPTLLRPVVAHNGLVRWSIRTKGVAAHSSDPTRGRSAISMMARVIVELETRYIPSLTAVHPLTGKAQCSLNVIRGGEAINVIPESCEIKVDRRTVPGEDQSKIIPTVDAHLDTLRAADPTLQVLHGEPFFDPSLDPAGNESYISLVQRVLRANQLDDTAIGAPYGTEASNLSNAGVPAVVLGPGDIAQAHSADEWIALDQLNRAIEVYYALMCERLEGSG